MRSRWLASLIVVLSLLSACSGTGSDEGNENASSGSTEASTEPAPSASEPAPSEPAPSEPAPSEPAPSEPAPSEPAPSEPEADSESESDSILTVQNSKDLAALLAGSDSDYDMIEGFAAKYNGRSIEFDGNIAAMTNHGDYDTRYDILVLAGDYSESSATGPYFQFQDVGILDLNLTGSNVPDNVGMGDNLHIVARVEDFNPDSGLFFLEPIATEVR